MKCLKFLYRLFFKRKETPIIKISEPNLNCFLIVNDLESTYDTNPKSSTC